MEANQGVEPRFPRSERGVLPLNELAIKLEPAVGLAPTLAGYRPAVLAAERCRRTGVDTRFCPEVYAVTERRPAIERYPPSNGVPPEDRTPMSRASTARKDYLCYLGILVPGAISSPEGGNQSVGCGLQHRLSPLSRRMLVARLGFAPRTFCL